MNYRSDTTGATVQRILLTLTSATVTILIQQGAEATKTINNYWFVFLAYPVQCYWRPALKEITLCKSKERVQRSFSSCQRSCERPLRHDTADVCIPLPLYLHGIGPLCRGGVNTNHIFWHAWSVYIVNRACPTAVGTRIYLNMHRSLHRNQWQSKRKR